MAALSNYLESGLINHILRGIPYSAPSTLYIGLVQNFDSGSLRSGITSAEPTGGSYARQSYTSNSSNWITPFFVGASGATYNNINIQFPVATADIGNISGVFFADAATSGNLLFFGQLNAPRNIRTGDQFVFSSGLLKISLN
jgi:hypothetical protein